MKLKNIWRDSSAFIVTISIFTYNFYLKYMLHIVDIRVTYVIRRKKSQCDYVNMPLVLEGNLRRDIVNENYTSHLEGK